MKMYIAKCFFGNKVIKFRTQAHSTEGLEPTANAMIIGFTHRIPEKVEFCLCPIQR